MPLPRLHLVAPSLPAADLAACFAAACETGDVASIRVRPELVSSLLAIARDRDVALITTEAAAARKLGCDGVEVSSRADYDAARELLGYSHIVGAHCGSSRHRAMELADAGADYVAFAQGHDRPGVDPIVRWWSELFEIPCIAADPVEAQGLAALLSQQPDFIRPSNRMWQSADDARAVVGELVRAIAGTYR